MNSYQYQYHCETCGLGGAGLCRNEPPFPLPCPKCNKGMTVSVNTIPYDPSLPPFGIRV